jgi:hypothetical protein
MLLRKGEMYGIEVRDSLMRDGLRELQERKECEHERECPDEI